MKRKTFKALICCTLIAAALTFTACGNKSDTGANSATSTDSSEQSSADQEKSSGSSLSDLLNVKTVEDFLATDMMQSQLESAKASMSDQGLEFDITADGNKLVYIYKYTDTDLDVASTAEGLESAASNTEEQLQSVYNAMVEAGIEDPIIVAQFLASDGSEIYIQQYPAE